MKITGLFSKDCLHRFHCWTVAVCLHTHRSFLKNKNNKPQHDKSLYVCTLQFCYFPAVLFLEVKYASRNYTGVLLLMKKNYLVALRLVFYCRRALITGSVTPARISVSAWNPADCRRAWDMCRCCVPLHIMHCRQMNFEADAGGGSQAVTLLPECPRRCLCSALWTL